jgi:hypothetical protein
LPATDFTPEGVTLTHMNDYKNIFLAWVSTVSSVFAAVEMKTVMTIISAVVLPVIFFTIGKTVDVAVQVYLKRREERRKPEQE